MIDDSFFLNHSIQYGVASTNYQIDFQFYLIISICLLGIIISSWLIYKENKNG